MAKTDEGFLTRRIVLDTNVYISSILFGGVPRKVASSLKSPDCLQIISEPLLNELARILEQKFHKLPDFITAELDSIVAASLLILPTHTIQACRDPDDNRVLECAVSGDADLIVSGDRDLLTLHIFQQIPILTPRQFLDRFPGLLGPHTSPSI